MDYNVTYRKKDKGWQCIISYKLGDAWKQKAKQGFKTQKEYKDWIDDTLEELKKIADNYTDGYTLEMLLNKFYEDYTDSLSAYTINTYEVSIKKFEPLIHKSIESITTDDIQLCVNSMTGLEKSSIQLHLSKLNRLYNLAITKYKLIKDNPIQDITIPEKEVPRRDRMALTTGELKKVLKEYDGNLKLKTFIAIAGYTGLRCGEITGLTKNDIEDKYINVNKQWKKLRDGTYGFAILKNKDKGRRKVPIAPDLRLILDEYLPTCKQDRIFPYKNSYVSSTSVNTSLKGKGFELTLHELRHTFATNLLANGLDLKTVAYLLGDTINTVTRTYLHFTRDMMENAERIIGNNFFG